MSERPITPVAITLLDGQERKFLLSAGALKRLKEKFGAKTLKDIFDRDAVDAGIPILYEALLDKDGLSEDQFADLLPGDLMKMTEAILSLVGVSFPEAERPTRASPTIQ